MQGHEAEDLSSLLWEDRTLVNTWLMRGTLHVVSADDLPLCVGALDNRGQYVASWLRHYGPTAKQMERLIAAIGELLAGVCLTREELVAAVRPRAGKALAECLRSGWGEFLKPATRQGVLCFGQAAASM